MKKILRNISDTKELAIELKKNVKKNVCFLLSGDLGSGKTTFTKILLSEIGITENVSSPTFVILNQYEGKEFLINHMDAYRLKNDDMIDDFVEQFYDSFNIIEWWENINFNFGEFRCIKINFKMIDDNTREVEII